MFLKKQADNNLWIIAGLGNPEKQYDNTRHNAGFEAMDIFCENNGIELNKKKFNACYGECKIKENRIIAVKPQTYMNNSGEAVGALARFYKVPNNRVIIISDDVSLPVGKIRIRSKGSAGGHNGLKSIISYLGGEDFPRVKVGVGEKPSPEYDMVNWVLGKIPKEQQETYKNALSRAAKAAEEAVTESIESVMNRYNA